MPFYQRLGDVPRKRHIQFRDNGTLLTEEVMGLEGFDGNESILYHLTSPCRVERLGGFEPIERKEWVPDEHRPLHLKTWEVDAGGDAEDTRSDGPPEARILRLLQELRRKRGSPQQRKRRQRALRCGNRPGDGHGHAAADRGVCE